MFSKCCEKSFQYPAFWEALAFCDGRLIADRSAAAILCDPALIEQAALKETSLYTLANRCGITPAEKFVERFIAADREVRADGC